MVAQPQFLCDRLGRTGLDLLSLGGVQLFDFVTQFDRHGYVLFSLSPAMRASTRSSLHAETTESAPCSLRLGRTVISTSCRRAVRNSISRPTEKFPARFRLSKEP